MVAILHDWVLFPLVLAALSLGCGLLLERIADFRMPGVLLLPAGFAVVLTVADLVTSVAALARFTTGVVVALAVVGFALGLPDSRRPARWVTGAAIAVFLVYAAPILLSGGSTFAGYVKLDDTSTWLAMADRLLDHGRTIDLPPSTYREALRAYVTDSGYPVGSVLPLGIAAKLSGNDYAWSFQPYLAYQAGLLALCFEGLLAGLLRRNWLRAVVVFVAAQPALLFGFSLWGGVKELVTVPLMALVAALALDAVRRQTGVRGTIPLAVASAALLAVLNVGGGVWLALALLPTLLLVRKLRARTLLIRAGAFLGIVCLLALPTLVTAGSFFGTARHSLTGASELGNLIEALDIRQIGGIWLHGDFRFHPHDLTVTTILVCVVCAAAVLGIVLALRRRQGALPAFVIASLVGAAVYASFGSPWVDAKVLATASPALLLAAMAGAGLLFERGNRVEAAVIAAAITLGVGWSNVYQGQAVWLAPRDQLGELESIGHEFAGQGPSLINEYQPFGGRHFLRQTDPESAGELRFHTLLLRNFSVVQQGGYADIDQYPLSTVLSYPLLVLPRSPIESRPPSVYTLARSGRSYDVWQRDQLAPYRVLEHLSLGSTKDLVGVPACEEVLRLGRLAADAHGRLLYVPRKPRYTIPLDGVPINKAADIEIPLVLPAGTYRLWLEGSFPSEITLLVDGKKTGSARHRLEHPGQFVDMGTARVGEGGHVVTFRQSGPDLHAGSAAGFFSRLDQLVLAETTEDVAVESIAPERARSLCGRQLDWIEATD